MLYLWPSLVYFVTCIVFIVGLKSPNSGFITNFTFQAAKFRVLLHENDRVFIGARDSLYSVKFDAVKDARKMLEWRAYRPYNYLLYMNKRRESPQFTDYFICGTYASSQKCEVFRLNKNQSQLVPTGSLIRNGGLVPWKPDISYVHSTKGSIMYIATFNPPDVRPRPYLQKFNIDDGYQLNSMVPTPFFVGNQRVKFFKFMSRYQFQYLIFSEMAEEAPNPKLIPENVKFKDRYTRILRFCSNDPGISMASYSKGGFFTTMLKARLLCSQLSTDEDDSYRSYDFNRLLTVSDLSSELIHTQKSGLTDRSDSFIGLFSTNHRPIGGQYQIAFCSYALNDVDKVFRAGKLYENGDKISKMTVNLNVSECSNWQQQRYHPIYSLLKDPVYSIGKQPFYFMSVPYLPTSIVVDWNIRFVLGNYTIKHADLAYIGTDDGKVLKMLLQGNHSSQIIDEYQVFNNGVIVHTLLISRKDGKLMAVSDDAVASIPLHRCSKYVSCSMCASSSDLFCTWDFKTHSCVTNPQIQSTEYSLFVEDNRDKCLTHYPNAPSEGRPVSFGSYSSQNKNCSSQNEFVIYILLIIILILVILLIAICVFPNKFEYIRSCKYSWPFLTKRREINDIVLERKNPENVAAKVLRKPNFESNATDQIAIRYSHFQESRKAVANVYQEISYIDHVTDDPCKTDGLLQDNEGIDRQFLIISDSPSIKSDSPVYEETSSNMFRFNFYKNHGMMASSTYSQNHSP